MSSGARMPTKSPHHTEEDFLEVDKPIPGQSFCCVSFVIHINLLGFPIPLPYESSPALMWITILLSSGISNL